MGRGSLGDVPQDVAEAVSAAAAESILMGVFVLVCAFELRGVKAGVVAPTGPICTPPTPSAATMVRQPSISSQFQGAPFNQVGRGAAPSDLDSGSVYGAEEPLRAVSSAICDHIPGQQDKDAWPIGPLVMMMILLHVIYPSFPVSPQVEMGRIMTFLGFLWSVGPMRCIAVVNTEPMHRCRMGFLAGLGVAVHGLIFVMTDTISDLIFPQASKSTGLYQGPRYLHQLLTYLTIRYPARAAGPSVGLWTAWIVVGAVIFSSAVWKEFLFRGIYLGGLRTRMPFWAANMTTGLVYALAHEPLQVSSDGSVSLRLVACAPLLMGALWHGYLYHCCNNLVVTVLAHLLFNAGLLALHLRLAT